MDDEKEKGLNSLLKRLGKVDFEPIKGEEKKEETSAREKAVPAPAPAPVPVPEPIPVPPPVQKKVEPETREKDEVSASVRKTPAPPKASREQGEEATISDILKRLKADIPETPPPRNEAVPTVEPPTSPPPAREQKPADAARISVQPQERPKIPLPVREKPKTVAPPVVAPPPVNPLPPEPVPVEKSVEARSAKKTRWSEGGEEPEEAKVVTVDEIKDISDLILPKGATFEIDEVHLQGRTTPFGSGETLGTIPREIDDLWKASLPSTTLGEISGEGGEEKRKSLFDGFKKLSISKVIRPDVEEYNPKIHGPLVDLAMRPQPGIEEVELYPLNEPFAYVRVLLDNNTHEYTYQVLEPALSVAEKDLLQELKERLFETLDVNTKDLTKDKAKKVLRNSTDDIIFDFGLKLTPISREKILYNIEKEFIGDGLIDPIMHDKYIEDISCDGVRTTIFVYHTSYENIKTNLMYETADDLDSFVTKLAQRAGKYISIAEPMLDATMSDGSRIQMTLGREVTAHGSTFTIRKFRDEPITPTDLVEWGTFSPLSIAFFWLAVEAGKS
ncbi:MAG: type II/IV secretion system ATPase subunit, partial [Methanomicrobiales archaeon]|nr:type II/IV secretion system ATPase subunit [Methanomicrobiales archaeon]